ncbi:hypothetical protein ACLB2K_011128 [Fragaria x ananassa]
MNNVQDFDFGQLVKLHCFSNNCDDGYHNQKRAVLVWGEQQPSCNQRLLNPRGLEENILRSLPKVWYTAEVNEKLKDCTICLMEYEGGDALRVLPPCGHGFHVNCVASLSATLHVHRVAPLWLWRAKKHRYLEMPKVHHFQILYLMLQILTD